MSIFTRFSRIVLTVFVILTFTVPFAVAQGVNIPDANLRARVVAFLSKNSGDTITVANMRSLTLLSAVNAGIRDLTGLERATNLLWLDLSDNAISDISPLIRLPQLAGLYLNNNPLNARSVNTHIPMLLDRGVDVSYTLPSDVNSDGIVNIQDLVSITQHFGGAGDLTADVNRDGIVSIKDLTQVAGDIGQTTVNAAATDTVDTVPSDEPLRDEAFIFKKFLEQLLADWKAAVPSFDYDVDTIFQIPGKGYHVDVGHYGFRPSRWKVLGIFIPDILTNATVDQVNRFSSEYHLTEEELLALLRHLHRARILVIDPLRHVVYMPDQNLRKVVVALINELGISLGPINRPKELFDPIYAGEMWRIDELEAEAAGIENLTGLEYGINLNTLALSNDPVLKDEEWIESETPNKISDLRPLEELTNLEWLGLAYNEIEDLSPLSDLTNLRGLAVGENKITDITPLANLTNLVDLVLNNRSFHNSVKTGNSISDLTPLKKLTKLEELIASRNPIGSSISVVRNFPKLKLLIISCCGVWDLSPLVGSPGLRAGSWAQVGANPLGVEDIPDLEALRKRGVKLTGLFYSKDDNFLDNGLHLCR